MRSRRAVIVGAGVSGLSTAYHLKRLGFDDIVVFEKDRIGAGSSSRAAGISTGLLWSKTGVLARKTALRRFREMSGELDGYAFHNEHGCLNLFSPELWPGRAQLLPLYDELDVPYQVMAATEIRRRWPHLAPPDDFIGLHDPLGGYSEPAVYLPALAAKLQALGVEIVEQTAVQELLVRDDRVTGVRTDAGVTEADAVVVVNYAWILPLLASAGLSIPAKTFVHQRYVSRPLDGPIAIPPVNADPFLGYVRPADGNRILIGAETPDRDEFRVGDASFQMSALSEPMGLREDAVARFADFLPALRDVQWESSKVGLLSFSMDGEPVLGPMESVEGLFVGACFHSGGFSYNPAVGFYLAEMVARGKTSIDLTAFSPDRFAASDAADYLASTVPQRLAARRRH